ncbi:MAG TPA: hypothetical protein P5528_11130 [Steroidobacteraceae bacterium]|nr:hypothetical protein [Steroidobacteraceae bacterium]HRX89984.1 hypothetical protein [Steroidobacteraceae bacterium]
MFVFTRPLSSVLVPLLLLLALVVGVELWDRSQAALVKAENDTREVTVNVDCRDTAAVRGIGVADRGHCTGDVLAARR